MTEGHHEEFTSGSAREARQRVVAAMDGCEPAVAPTELMVSELVTNALIHAGDDVVRVVVDHGEGHVHVSVSDSSPIAPTPREPDPETPGGLGLHIVESLSSEWGVEQHASDGKSVWFDIDCDAPDGD